MIELREVSPILRRKVVTHVNIGVVRLLTPSKMLWMKHLVRTLVKLLHEAAHLLHLIDPVLPPQLNGRGLLGFRFCCGISEGCEPRRLALAVGPRLCLDSVAVEKLTSASPRYYERIGRPLPAQSNSRIRSRRHTRMSKCSLSCLLIVHLRYRSMTVS